MIMYIEYFGFERNPLPTTPNLDFFYGEDGKNETIEAIDFGLKQSFGIIKVIGHIGSGKTILCRQAHKMLNSSYNIIFISDPALADSESILSVVSRELSPEIDLDKPKNKIFHQLIQALINLRREHKPCVLFVEEAQKLSVQQLEELRYLTNLETSQDKLMQIVLFGQPSLDAVLLQTDAQLLSSRITQSIFIKPFNFSGFKRYIEHRFQIAGLSKPSKFFTSLQLWVIYHISDQSLRFAHQLIEKTLFSTYTRQAKKPSLLDIATGLRSMEQQKAHIKYSRVHLLSCFSVGIMCGWLIFTLLQPLTATPQSYANTTVEDTQPIAKDNNDVVSMQEFRQVGR